MASVDLRQGVWRFYTDATPDGSMAALANENVAPTLTTAQMQDGIIRLRVQLVEIGGKTTASSPIHLSYSYDQTNWQSIDGNPPTDSGEHYRWASGAATAGNTIGSQLLTGTGVSGLYHEDDSDFNEAVTASTTQEIDIAIQAHWPPPNTTVYFRLTHGATTVPLNTGATIISLDTSTAANRGYAIDKLSMESDSTVPRTYRYPSWNKIFHDGTRWWFFVVDRAAATTLKYYSWDGPGNDWVSRSSITLGAAADKNCFDVAFKVISGTPVVVIASTDSSSSTGSTVYINRGEISGTTITWDSEYSWSRSWEKNTVACDFDDGNYLWVIGMVQTTDQIWCARATNADTGTSWSTGFNTAHVTVGEDAPSGQFDYVNIIGLASSKALVMWYEADEDVHGGVVTESGGYGTLADLFFVAASNDVNHGVVRCNGYVYMVSTNTANTTGGTILLQVFDEADDSVTNTTSPGSLGVGGDDGLVLVADAETDKIYMFGSDSVGSIGGRIVEYNVYTGPDTGGSWSGTTTITPATDRQNCDYLHGPALAVNGVVLITVLYGDNNLIGSYQTMEYHYLTLPRSVPCTTGALAIAGQAATVDAGSGIIINCTAGALAIAGQAASVVAGAVSISCTDGALSIAGNQASAVPGVVTISGVVGAVTATGSAATVVPGAISIACTADTLVSAGNSATVTPGAVSVTCGVAATTIAGISATVLTTTQVDCTAGTITSSGIQATVVPGAISVVCSSGSATIAGVSATVVPGSVSVTCTDGALTSAGYAAAVDVVAAINCAVGTIVSAGQTGAVVAGAVSVSCTVGTLVSAGLSASVVAGALVTCSTGTLSIAGQGASVTPGAVSVGCVVATLTSATYAATATSLAAIPCSVGALAIAGQGAAAVPGEVNISCTEGTITSAGLVGQILSGEAVVSATSGALLSAGYTGAVDVTSVVPCVVGSLTIAGLTGSVSPGSVLISTTFDTIISNGHAANILATASFVPIHVSVATQETKDSYVVD